MSLKHEPSNRFTFLQSSCSENENRTELLAESLPDELSEGICVALADVRHFHLKFRRYITKWLQHQVKIRDRLYEATGLCRSR